MRVDFYCNMSNQQRKSVSFSQKLNAQSGVLAFTGLFDELQKIDERDSRLESHETIQSQERREGHILK